MTRERRDNGGTPFGDWLRRHPELDSKFGYDGEDIDGTQRYIWHQYKRGYLRLLEIKCCNASQSFAQADTQSIIDQTLRFAFTHPDFSADRAIIGRPTTIKYLGYSLVQLESTRPDNGRIRIDGRLVTEREFLRFLKFEDMQEVEQRDYMRYLVEEIGRALDEQERWGVRTDD